MTARLVVEGLGVSYRGNGSGTDVLKEISFELGAGERLAIIGESGSGKSTLALAIAGLLPTDARMDGAIHWPGLGRQPQNGRDIGFVFRIPPPVSTRC